MASCARVVPPPSALVKEAVVDRLSPNERFYLLKGKTEEETVIPNTFQSLDFRWTGAVLVLVAEEEGIQSRLM